MEEKIIPIKEIQFPGSDNVYSFDISNQIDITFPESATDNKIPSTKLVKDNITTLQGAINSVGGVVGSADKALENAKTYTNEEINKLSNGAVATNARAIDANTSAIETLKTETIPNVESLANTYQWHTITRTIKNSKITIGGINENSLVFVSPTTASVQQYYENSIYCASQNNEGVLTFASATGDPVPDLLVNIAWTQNPHNW